MRIDIMTDIETLGTNSDSTIIQISAIAFDIITGNYISEFNKIVDISKNNNMKVTGDTIKWWLNTNKELLTELLNSGDFSSEEALASFHRWLNNIKANDTNDIYLWGNGILFDNKMIEHQFKEIGLDYPVFYRNDRDMRTLVDLASVKLGITEKELKSKFEDDSLVLHNALDDVKYQINLTVECYKILTN